MSGKASVKAYFDLPPALWEEVRITASAFAVLIVVSFAVSRQRPEWAEPLLRLFTDAAAEIGMYQIRGGTLMVTILSNNLLSLLTVIAVGLIPLLHLPALSLGLNALLIGGLAAFYQREGLGLAAYLAGTLPHGITELSALVLSCAAGLYACRAATYCVLGKVERRTVANTLSLCLRVYTHWVVPLLIFSAAVEAFITPLIFSRFY